MRETYWRCFIISLCLLLARCIDPDDDDEVFNFDADKMLDQVMLEAENMKEYSRNLLMKMKNVPEEAKREQYITTTTQAPQMAATKHVPKQKITKEFLKRRKIEFETFKVLNRSDYTLNLDFSHDDTIGITRRFDKMRKTAKENKNKKNYRRQFKPILREFYLDWQNQTAYQEEKNKLVDIMVQFIYLARYTLIYPQMLRKKYMHDVKYKLGFCFALLRDLKRQQMQMYDIMQYNHDLKDIWIIYYTYLKVYEKVQRLDIDIKDVIKLIKQLEFKWKEIEFPDYYYFFEPSRGTVWRRKNIEQSDMQSNKN